MPTSVASLNSYPKPVNKKNHHGNDPALCARCQSEPRLEYHSWCRLCRNKARREDWKRLPADRKQILYDARKVGSL